MNILLNPRIYTDYLTEKQQNNKIMEEKRKRIYDFKQAPPSHKVKVKGKILLNHLSPLKIRKSTKA